MYGIIGVGDIMKKIVDHIQNLQILSKDNPIVLAVSTGIDSMVLLHALHSLKFNCVIAHVNHQKRKQSLTEQAFIQSYSKQCGFPFETINLTLENSNFQEQAREKRYQFFKAVAKKYNTRDIVLAHHQDDQVETIMMRLIRGSSFQGYEGMKPSYKEDGYRFIRPLLSIPKSDIITYAQAHDVPYYTDASNESSVYTRNRIRHQISPLLEEENPQYRDKITQLANYIHMANDVITPLANTFLDTHYHNDKLNLSAFKQLKDIVKITVLQHLINDFTDNQVEVSYTQYQAMLDIAMSDVPNQEYHLSDQYRFIKTYNYITLENITKNTVKTLTITQEGCYKIDDTKAFFVTHNKLDQNHRNYFQLWYNELVFPLYLRTRQNGDKMSLNVGTKKIKDIFIDQKVPKHLRDHIILLTNETHVLWIPGIKKADQDQSKQRILYIYEVTKC